MTKSAKQVNICKKRITPSLLNKQKILMLMSFPFLIWLIIFAYVPLWGWIMAFQNYRPDLGIRNSPWAGLEHFRRLFADQQFHEAFRNTIGQSLFLLAIGFTMPVIFALMLNEVKYLRFKKIAQTISYLPHFVSWVIVASILGLILNTGGPINTLLLNMGLIERPIAFLGVPNMFWPLLAISDTWKNIGWNAIIYIAAIASVDQALYEAAAVDGAGRWRKMWHITLPGIRTVIIILLVLNIGRILDIGFERQILLGNPVNQSHSRTIDQYALEYGTQMFRFSYGTAVGMFKSVISLILVLAANRFARKLDAGVF
ncbi:MAG: ABC transporter permease subunit [Defluviitaleaceae bacterium]|nr:ABC transporter permease subunit [Defluviitaleaceae bacterium]MCL2836703.1 ABC transporter permease subunit [Defluviitaleaceae bacterium]